VTAPGPGPDAVTDGDGLCEKPWLRRAPGGPGTYPLESVGTWLDLVDRSEQRAAQGTFQVVLGSGHAVTSLPAAS
jgi:hypothetical protein